MPRAAAVSASEDEEVEEEKLAFEGRGRELMVKERGLLGTGSMT